ncbi:hypothetical protein KM043_017832 [Ampulex compressa]|nr:hypothetical protein KM043_017832 [Ampulex compressa]
MYEGVSSKIMPYKDLSRGFKPVGYSLAAVLGMRKRSRKKGTRPRSRGPLSALADLDAAKGSPDMRSSWVQPTMGVPWDTTLHWRVFTRKGRRLFSHRRRQIA